MKDKAHNVIYKTENLAQFKTAVNNRRISTEHVYRLATSMKKRDLLHAAPIIVNEKKEVIDGQHRLEAARRLRLPVYYMVCPNLDEVDIRIMNTNNRNWTLDDYMNAYISAGYEAYKTYKKFKDMYQLSHTAANILISIDGKVDSSTKPYLAEFKTGELEIRDWDRSCQWAENLKGIGKYYDGIGRRAFVRAIFKVMNTSGYDHDRMMANIEANPSMIHDCPTIVEYLRMLEGIYNRYGRNKLRFF